MNFHNIILRTTKQAGESGYTIGFVNNEKSFDYSLFIDEMIFTVSFIDFGKSVRVEYSEFNHKECIHQYVESYSFSHSDDDVEESVIHTINRYLNEFYAYN